MPDGTAYEYTYGDNNELREIRLPGTDAISYPSYTWTRPDAVQYPGGGRREYEYDPLMRITRILAKDPGKNILLDYSYSYDSMDNILSKQTGQGTYNYTYDALYRLTDVQVDIPGQENEGFSYDTVGNRLSEQGVEGEWTYNDNNELLTFATTEYTYDANGNATHLLLNGTVMFTYHYNAQDRLVQVDDVNGSTIAEYVYDPFGRRLWKEVDSTRTYFFYADEGLVAEYDTSGTEIRAYGYRPDSTWTTDPLWLKQGNEYYFYQNDHLGTPQKLVQMNGAIAWSVTYTIFGQANVDIETVTNNLRFSGQYEDGETGWHYNWMRYYHPNIGRFLTADPSDRIINVYRYCVNNPVVFIDPYGLFHQGQAAAGDKTVPFGHSDFYGSKDIGGYFDYNREDTSQFTKPTNWPFGTMRHFRNLYDVERDLVRTIFIYDCDAGRFERHMHQGQDYYTHYEKGYRWWFPHGFHPFHWLPGHTAATIFGKPEDDPDKDRPAWWRAENWTAFWVKLWDEMCCDKDGDGTWERNESRSPGIIGVGRW